MVHTKEAAARTLQKVITIEYCPCTFIILLFVLFIQTIICCFNDLDCKLSQTGQIDFQTKKKFHAKKITGFQVILVPPSK